MMDTLVRAVVLGCIRNLCMYYFRFFTLDEITDNMFTIFLTVYKALPYLLMYTMFYHVFGPYWGMRGAPVGVIVGGCIRNLCMY